MSRRMNLPKLLCDKGICISMAEARRLVNQGLLQLNGEKVIFKEGEKPELELNSGDRLKVKDITLVVP